jgi:hypothetical protein
MARETEFKPKCLGISMTATSVPGEGRCGGERRTIERHGWRYLRGRQSRFSLRRIGAGGNPAAEAQHHDCGTGCRWARLTGALRPKRGATAAGACAEIPIINSLLTNNTSYIIDIKHGF